MTSRRSRPVPSGASRIGFAPHLAALAVISTSSACAVATNGDPQPQADAPRAATSIEVPGAAFAGTVQSRQLRRAADSLGLLSRPIADTRSDVDDPLHLGKPSEGARTDSLLLTNTL